MADSDMPRSSGFRVRMTELLHRLVSGETGDGVIRDASTLLAEMKPGDMPVTERVYGAIIELQRLFSDTIPPDDAFHGLMGTITELVNGTWGLLAEYHRGIDDILRVRAGYGMSDSTIMPFDLDGDAWLPMLEQAHLSVLSADEAVVPDGCGDVVKLLTIPLYSGSLPLGLIIIGADEGALPVTSLADLRPLAAIAVNLVIAKHSQLERNFMQVQKEATEARYRAVVEDQTELICRFSAEEKITFINSAFARFFDVQYESLFNVRLGIFFHPDDRAGFQRAISSLGEGNPVARFECRVYARDKIERWVQWRVRNLSQHTDAASDFQAVGRDITDERWAKEHLRENREFLQSVVDNVLEGIITINDRGTVTSMNPAAEKIFGFQAEAVTGKNVSTLMPQPYRDEHDDYIRNYLATGERKIIGIGREVRGMRSDGTTFPMELAVSEMVTRSGRGFIGIVRDITERKRMDRMKNEFISMVSHELRTPLTSILGSLGLVSGGVTGKIPEKAASLIEIARSNSERLVNLINDILDIEKMDAGRMVFSFRPTDMAVIVKNAVTANEGYGTPHNVSIVFGTLEPSLVLADYDRMMQVMSNLLSNAVKFSPVGATVTVSVVKRDSTARVVVSDEGPGIPDDFRGRIFEKFAQADSSSSRSKGGTGLGLAITRMIVENHGGTIGFDTEVGKGTDFRFDIPLKSPDVHVVAQEYRTGFKRMLHVEDDADNARIVSDILWQVVDIDLAKSVEEARQKLMKGEYDLVLLDIWLPDGVGTTLFEEFPDIPFIVYASDIPELPEVDNIVYVLLKSRTSNDKLRSVVETASQIVRGGRQDDEPES